MTVDDRSALPAQRSTRFLVGLLVLGAIAAGSVLLGILDWQQVSRQTATATATVVQAGRCAGKSSLGGRGVVVMDGVRRTVSVDCSFEVGDTVVIHYNPANPNNYREASTWRSGFVHGGTYFSFGVTAICIVVIVVRVRNQLRRRQTILEGVGPRKG